ncbi:hypothetical protein GE21DRAFT_4951 [Neurospora crassa]|uniref:Uncharacterized protein n=1 Tax=Neurospora crassa (strain ATCC 24698 / 74-OR23-1A / CBS 708.71 / DSM 1257 / FGSC 987) TaxID=367110 RepID=Q7S318_NEUCR|nr:hypothetical protein NCU07529 [Neurospora crassa OR74A]EAA29806.1 hypothetical protein NCU07529 [Neurospora crassa OR74A]KHE80137.1 hypothetical protein GE21DRAFT_4951 [Neurospora crassa]|eukprot:XP_959042.1 hypothetical protein NCU07529 [Neurospora crassa OR74A]
MDRDQNTTEDLFDLENRLTASLLRTFQSLLHHGASSVNGTASVGQAAYNAMATDILMNGMVQSVEELLSLTRKMRELWVVGPLRKPGEGDEEVEREMRGCWEGVVQNVGGWRGLKRAEVVNKMGGKGKGVGEYKEGEVGMPAGVVQQQQFGQFGQFGQGGQGSQGGQGGGGLPPSGSATPNMGVRNLTAAAGGGAGAGGPGGLGGSGGMVA